MIDALSYRHWAISQQFANTLGVMALRLLAEGKSIEHLIKKLSHVEILERYQSRLVSESADGIIAKISWESDARLYVATTNQGQNVAMIPIFGALTKNGDLCSYGMRDYVGMIDRANKSDKIAAIVLDTESPGGTVDGTNEFALAVRASKKPVVTFGDGMVASAAYWVTSQSRHIVANKHNGTEFGSIGVLYVHENYQAYIAKEIGEIEIIRAPQSVDKARINAIEPLTDEQRAEIRAELKDIAKDFISVVKKGRGSALQLDDENIFTGKMYPASRALELGMIDSLGTIQDAINIAGQLATGGPLTSANGSQAHANTSMFKSKLLSSLFGKSEKAEESNPSAGSETSVDAQIDARIAEMEAENARLEEASTAQAARIAELESQVSERDAQVSTLTTEKSELEAQVTELQAQLEAAPAGHATTAVADSDPEGEGEKSKFHTSVDEEVAKYASVSKPK